MLHFTLLPPYRSRQRQLRLLFFFFLCTYIYIYVRLYVYIYTCVLSVILFSFSCYSESFIGKKDSPTNGRLIKQNFIVLVTVIEKKELHTL
jgi:hypothetical protein